MSLEQAQLVLEKAQELADKILEAKDLDDLQKAQLAQELVHAKETIQRELGMELQNLDLQSTSEYSKLENDARQLEVQLQKILATIDFSQVKNSLDQFSSGLIGLLQKHKQEKN